MDPIHIDFTIPDLSLYVGFGLLVFAITLFLAISKHREKLGPAFAFIRAPSKYALPLLFLILIPLALIAVYDIYGLISDREAWGDDKRGLAVLLAAITGAPFVIWRTWIAQKQSATAEQSHMTDRITKAVEQLGAEKTVKAHRKSKKGAKMFEEDDNGDLDYRKPVITETTEPNLEVRLGAIYALERIAQDSLRDHIPVMEILCAYVRLNSPTHEGYKPEKFVPSQRSTYSQSVATTHFNSIDTKNGIKHDDKIRKEIEILPESRIDIQAALTAIGRRSISNVSETNNIPFSLDLSKCNLQKAKLIGNFRGVDLSNSFLDGASLDGDFRDSKINGISRLHWRASGEVMAIFQNLSNQWRA